MGDCRPFPLVFFGVFDAFSEHEFEFFGVEVAEFICVEESAADFFVGDHFESGKHILAVAGGENVF